MLLLLPVVLSSCPGPILPETESSLDDSTAAASDTSHSQPVGTSTGIEGGLCGNGEIDVSEECDGDDFCFDCIRDRVVFVTGYEARFSGSAVGSVAHADEICDRMARKAGLDGPVGDRRFRAWLSDEVSSPLTRFTTAQGRYVRPDGLVIASEWGQVSDGLINAPRLNALGEDEYDLEVWTATLPNGAWEGSGSCGQWTSDAAVAAGGTADKVGLAWTFAAVSNCRELRALYCVEQLEKVVCHQNPCWTNSDCEFGNECYPAVDGLGVKTCSPPCKTDAACKNDCGSNPAPVATCTSSGYCKVVLCKPGDTCNCQPWVDGFFACFGPPT
jgi:hypothetical protein